MAKKNVELIYVVPVERGRVGFAEAHEDHPGGEAWVASNADSDEAPEPVQIARTPTAQIALARQRIKEVPAPKSANGKSKPKPKPQEKVASPDGESKSE